MTFIPQQSSGRGVAICRSIALLIYFTLASCDDTTGLPDASPLPVVQLLLVPGRSEQLATVHYSSPAQPIVPRLDHPVRSDSVALALLGPDSIAITFEAVLGSPGLFRAVLAVAPLVEYRIVGQVGEAAISATARVPGSMLVRQPGADTLRLSSTQGLVSVAFEWYAPGADSYLALETDKSGREQLTLATSDTSGTLLLSPFTTSRPDTVRLSFSAYDPAAASFFLNRNRIVTSDRGVIVGFGAVTPAVRETVIVWSVP